MKRIFAIALLALAGLGLSTISFNAEAKRLGGGSSIGKQSQSLSRPAPTAPGGFQQSRPQPAAPAAAPAPAPAGQSLPAPKPPSPWKGILGGALAGIGLGMLFSHMGMGAGMAGALNSIFMIFIVVGLVMLAMRMFRRRAEPAYAGAAPTAYAYQEPAVRTPEIGSRIEQPLNAAPAAAPAAANLPFGIPEGFDTAGFLRNAKTYFIRLQAAWDRADLNDIREFTSPEMFAEIRMQITERGASSNNTDVVSLDAEMLGIETHPDYYLASVKFSGRISEAQGAPAEPFTEIWNLSKPVNGGGWVLAGIQQLS